MLSHIQAAQLALFRAKAQPGGAVPGSTFSLLESFLESAERLQLQRNLLNEIAICAGESL